MAALFVVGMLCVETQLSCRSIILASGLVAEVDLRSSLGTDAVPRKGGPPLFRTSVVPLDRTW